MFPRGLKIAVVVMGYWSVYITLVFANKHLVGTGSHEDASIFVAWMQCVVTSALVLLLYACAAVCGLRAHREACFSYRHMWCRPVLLMTASFVSMLTFNNLCLHHVHLSFYQVARSMTLVFTVLLSVVILRRKVSMAATLCCVLVIKGFVLGVDQESFMATLSVKGVLFGVTASLFVALNGIFTKQALVVVKGNTIGLTLYTNLNAVVLFIPILLLTGQSPVFMYTTRLDDVYFFVFLVSTGGLGFLIAWVSALQIHLTSPVTHHISSNTKAVLQTVLAVMYYRESKGALWWLSNALVVGGAVAYACVTSRQIHTAVKRQQEDSHSCNAPTGKCPQP